jgi:hypothetical protein
LPLRIIQTLPDTLLDFVGRRVGGREQNGKITRAPQFLDAFQRRRDQITQRVGGGIGHLGVTFGGGANG